MPQILPGRVQAMDYVDITAVDANLVVFPDLSSFSLDDDSTNTFLTDMYSQNASFSVNVGQLRLLGVTRISNPMKTVGISPYNTTDLAFFQFPDVAGDNASGDLTLQQRYLQDIFKQFTFQKLINNRLIVDITVTSGVVSGSAQGVINGVPVFMSVTESNGVYTFTAIDINGSPYNLAGAEVQMSGDLTSTNNNAIHGTWTTTRANTVGLDTIVAPLQAVDLKLRFIRDTLGWTNDTPGLSEPQLIDSSGGRVNFNAAASVPGVFYEENMVQLIIWSANDASNFDQGSVTDIATWEATRNSAVNIYITFGWSDVIPASWCDDLRFRGEMQINF